MALIHYRDWAEKAGIASDTALRRIQSGSLPSVIQNGVYYIDADQPIPPKGSRWHKMDAVKVCVICGNPVPSQSRSTCSEACRHILATRSKRRHPPNAHRHKLEGQTFGELSIQAYLGKGYYSALCSCGKSCAAHVECLRSGDTQSCGHLRSDIAKLAYKKKLGLTQGTNLTQLKSILNGKVRTTNTSGVTGVYILPRCGYVAYVAKITVQRKSIHLGIFADIESAKRARKKAEERYFRPLITPPFPESP